MKSLLLLLLAFSLSPGAHSQAYEGASRDKKRTHYLNETYCSGLFRSTEGSIYDVESDPAARNYTHILDWLEGRALGLQVFMNRAGVRVPVIRGGNPGVYIDEMPVGPEMLNALNVNDIAFVKVIRMPFFGGFNGANGAIAVYTLRGEEE